MIALGMVFVSSAQLFSRGFQWHFRACEGVVSITPPLAYPTGVFDFVIRSRMPLTLQSLLRVL